MVSVLVSPFENVAVRVSFTIRVGGTALEYDSVRVPESCTDSTASPDESVTVCVSSTVVDFVSGGPLPESSSVDVDVPLSSETSPFGAVRVTSKVTDCCSSIAPVQPFGVA
jgi:hypothetical protein